MGLGCSPDRGRDSAERETEGMRSLANHPIVALAALGSARRMRWCGTDQTRGSSSIGSALVRHNECAKLIFRTAKDNMPRKALITGITGQDGSYLAEFLLEKNYHVCGLVRRSSTINFERIAHLQDQVELIPGDLLDESSLIAAINKG